MEMQIWGTPVTGRDGEALNEEVTNACKRHPSKSGSSPPFFAALLRKSKLWCLRTENGIGTARAASTATAAAPQLEQTLRYQSIKRQPRSTESTPFKEFDSRLAATSPWQAGGIYHLRLPARPKNAHIKSQRVPLCAEPTTTTPSPHVVISECCSAANEQSTQPKSHVMGLSKTHRLIILLVVDAAFCVLELGIGYAVHSLALVADAFHMLNDVFSLCVGLWAVKRAKTGRTKNYTYGWQRAETLGALVNGVFLVALCLTIFLEAIQRFFKPQKVTNPKMVLIVGCLGLASNILGLFLFSDGHGHSHGGGGHAHSHSHNSAKNAEEGHIHSTERRVGADETTGLLNERRDNVESVLPSARGADFQGTGHSSEFTSGDESSSTMKVSDHTGSYKWQSTAGSAERHRRRASFFTGSIDDMPTHPAGRRDTIINASQLDLDANSDTHTEEGIETDDESLTKSNAVGGKLNGYGSIQPRDGPKDTHAAHKHRQPREQTIGGGHGHSHGDLNMRGVFLHVLGDALGNVGVIASALIIWLSKFPQRFYADPAISLIITLIILKTAIPLCQAAARILLQAVPMGMKIDEIRADIEDLEGVTSAHHIHVWQLSDTKLVASLHVRIAPEIKNPGSEGYMRLAREIQLCLREYGIRSSTIQPEFECALETIEEDSESNANGSTYRSSKQTVTNSKFMSMSSNLSDGKECMLDCEDAGAVLEQEESHHDHDHSHSHDNDEHDHDHNQGSDNCNGKNKHSHQH